VLAWDPQAQWQKEYLLKVGLVKFSKKITGPAFWDVNSKEFVLSSINETIWQKIRRLSGAKLGNRGPQNHFFPGLAGTAG
jgi:hypothetical protein